MSFTDSVEMKDDNLLVEVSDSNTTKEESGLVVVEKNENENVLIGKVLKKGTGHVNKEVVNHMTVEVGDTVYFTHDKCHETYMDNKKYYIVPEREALMFERN